MSTIPSIQVTNSATCPHGLPPGACPICSGGGAGGAASRPRETKKDEWSYMQCLMVGQMMKAQQASQAESRQMFEGQLAFMRQLAENLNNFITRAQNILSTIEKNLPIHMQKAFSALVKNILNPLLQTLEKLPKIIGEIEKFVADLRNKILDVAEKLNSIFGEMKNFIDRKLVKNFKKLVRKFLGLFVFTDDEESSPDEREFEVFKANGLKKIAKSLLKYYNKERKNGHPDSETAQSA